VGHSWVPYLISVIDLDGDLVLQLPHQALYSVSVIDLGDGLVLRRQQPHQALYSVSVIDWVCDSLVLPLPHQALYLVSVIDWVCDSLVQDGAPQLQPLFSSVIFSQLHSMLVLLL
jgi:hypothetical protein